MKFLRNIVAHFGKICQGENFPMYSTMFESGFTRIGSVWIKTNGHPTMENSSSLSGDQAIPTNCIQFGSHHVAPSCLKEGHMFWAWFVSSTSKNYLNYSVIIDHFKIK